VTPVTVVVPPPGNTTLQLGDFVHENGPEAPLQVVVWPEQVHDAGHVVRVVMLVTVIVLLAYRTDVVDAEDGEDVMEGEVDDEVGLATEVGQGS